MKVKMEKLGTWTETLHRLLPFGEKNAVKSGKQ